MIFYPKKKRKIFFPTKKRLVEWCIGWQGSVSLTDYCLIALQIGSHVPHPGVANDFDDEHAKKYYTYYQWVCFVLFFQVSFFSIYTLIKVYNSISNETI